MRNRWCLALAIVSALVIPAASAAAQCDASCTTLYGTDLKPVGHGCVTTPDSGKSCIATSERCRSSMCYNAFLSPEEGAAPCITDVDVRLAASGSGLKNLHVPRTSSAPKLTAARPEQRIRAEAPLAAAY
jgi:hypothetical protein